MVIEWNVAGFRPCNQWEKPECVNASQQATRNELSNSLHSSIIDLSICSEWIHFTHVRHTLERSYQCPIRHKWRIFDLIEGVISFHVFFCLYFIRSNVHYIFAGRNPQHSLYTHCCEWLLIAGACSACSALEHVMDWMCATDWIPCARRVSHSKLKYKSKKRERISKRKCAHKVNISSVSQLRRELVI